MIEYGDQDPLYTVIMNDNKGAVSWHKERVLSDEAKHAGGNHIAIDFEGTIQSSLLDGMSRAEKPRGEVLQAQ